jgi:hypothetical protein
MVADKTQPGCLMPDYQTKSESCHISTSIVLNVNICKLAQILLNLVFFEQFTWTTWTYGTSFIDPQPDLNSDIE